MTAVATAPSDGGFGIVELLVALAIAATLVVGVGGLFSSLADLRSRSEQSSSVMSALVDVQALASLAGEEADLVASAPSAAGFVLRRPQTNVNGPAVADVRLLGGNGRHILQLSRGSRLSSVDLSAFELVSLEYFKPDAQAQFWNDWDEVDSSRIAAARVVLVLGTRTWRPLVWVGDIYR